MPQSYSFTAKSNGILRALQTACHIAEAFEPTTLPQPRGKEYSAIWDTGATNSVINQRVIDECGLKQIGLTEVHGVNSVSLEPTYLVSVRLINNISFNQVTVTRGHIGGGSDVLIGMDIITTGDFVITNKGGVTIFSFCVPSILSTDFVAEHNQRELAKQQSSGKKDRKKRPKTFGKRK